MYGKSAELYDIVYLNTGKDYAAEADKVHAFIQGNKLTNGNRLLDVACGTGLHIGFLRDRYQIEGLDLDSKMLRVARRKFPDIPFHRGNMLDFDLGETFDVITCLFSSIGYVMTLRRLNRTIENMSREASCWSNRGSAPKRGSRAALTPRSWTSRISRSPA